MDKVREGALFACGVLAVYAALAVGMALYQASQPKRVAAARATPCPCESV